MLLIMPVLGFPSIVLTPGILPLACVLSFQVCSSCLFGYPIAQLMSLPTIQNLTTPDLRGHHLILAVILILKHATFLRLESLSPKLALTHAELDYRAANIDVNIQQYLMASSQAHSVELFAAFIMATDILPSNSSATDIVTDIMPSNSSVKNREKDHWFKRFLGPVFPRKSISSRNTGKDNTLLS
ncbi:hypothetical protein EDB86DRAFT_2326817 [Lactarius hatsudake]|nr:hypothetical protein EDB86DRAFT_2326817 [Lactarius hatsudake]